MTRLLPHESGIGLVVALLASGFFSIVGLGLALVVSMGLRADRNYADAVSMLDAAEAGVEIAARDLAMEPDWNLVLSGARRGRLVDGPPNGIKPLPAGGTISLTIQTNQLNCGKPLACTAAQMDAVSADRPWATNNPRWQPYLFGPLSAIGLSMRGSALYLAVWVADDGREVDGDPLRDAGNPLDPGRGVVLVRSEVFGAFGARRAIEALVTRVCWTENKMERCQPGLRVQSWKEVRQLIP